MIEVTCPKCNRKFTCEQPTAQMSYIVNCPYCGTHCRAIPKVIDVADFKKKTPFFKTRKGHYTIFGCIVAVFVALFVIAALIPENPDRTESAPLISINENGNIATTTPSPTPTPQTEGQIGDYIVTISNTKIVKNKYNGTDMLVVTYSFTNNSDNSRSFAWAIDDTLFQNGVETPSKYSNWGIENEYDPTNTEKEIQPGITLDVQCAYELADTTTDVDVEIEDVFSWSDEILKYTIEL